MADKDLTVHLKADDKITPAAKKAADALDDLERKDVSVDVAAPGLDDLTDKLGGMPGQLGDIGGAIGSLGAAGGFAGLAAAAVTAANAQADMAISAQTTADLTGSTVEEASKLQTLWGRTGADVNDLNDVLLQMNGALSQSPELASQLGINLNDGKDITQRFVEVTDKLAAGQLNAQQASALFGEEGVRQVGKLRTQFGALGDELDAIEPPITGKDVADAVEFKNAMAEMTESLKMAGGLYAKQLVSVFGDLSTIAKDIGDALPGAAGGENVTKTILEWSTGLGVVQKVLAAISGEDFTVTVGENIAGATTATKDFTAAGREATRVLQQQVDKKFGEQQKAQAEIAKAAMQRYSDTVSAPGFVAVDLTGGLAGMSAFTDQLFALGNIAQASETAIAGLTAGVKEGGLTFDVATEAGRKNQDALEGVARTIDTQLAAAYDQADGDMGTFKQNAEVISLTTLGRLQSEMGLSADETQALGEKLGLLPADIETRYKLSGDEEAKIKLGLLQTSIDDLPDSVETEVNQKIILGDYQGALATVNSYYANNPARLPVKPVILGSAYPAGYNPVTGSINMAPTATTATATAVPTAAPTGMAPVVVNVPRQTPTINIQAAVIGNRYDVERTVAQALRKYQRRNGGR